MITDSTSRFYSLESIIINGKPTYGRASLPDALQEANLTPGQIARMTITQQYVGRPDALANDVYGTPFLEWIIVMFNKPMNPLGWPQAGITIKLPTKDAVSRLL